MTEKASPQQGTAVCFFAITALSPATSPSESDLIRFDRSILPASASGFWQFSSFDLPDYRDTGFSLTHHLKITHQAVLSLPSEKHIHILSPGIAYPAATSIERGATWLLITAASKADSIWRAPLFTPDIAEQATLETLRRSKLSEIMADDAYYFGYSSNSDALE